MPHCAPPCARNACCTALNVPASATPSIVQIFVPSACSAGIRQLLTSAPSISIEHAPHSPSPQPSFVPVKPACSRKTSSNRAIGYASNDSALPLISHRRRILRGASGMHILQHLHQFLGRYRNLPDIRSRGVRHRVRDRRRGSIERQFAGALCACLLAGVKTLLL